MKARFHLPGLRLNFPLNMIFLGLLKQFPEYFREEIEIASFFGEFPMSLWNGGRLVLHDQCDEKFVRQAVKTINAQGVPVRFTYTNPLLTKEDLDDPYCNFCMQVADNGMNEVIVYSPILEEYIRKKYPSYKINSSTCKEIKNIDGILSELEKDYYMVVLDYNMNDRFDILEQIPMEHRHRVELLVNALCIPNCPRRGDHYKNISMNQRIVHDNKKLPPDKRKPVIPWTCEYGDHNCIHTIQGYHTYISPEAIWEKYIPMGYVNFKIEGRTANWFSLIDTYCHYMAKPERMGELRLLILNNLEGNGIITVHKPRPGVWP